MKLFCDLNSKTIIINEKQEKMLKEMVAYHGSKANFDEFNLAYMGSGIGAQEFGEGLYLTFDKDAAYSYGGTVYTVDIPNENMPWDVFKSCAETINIIVCVYDLSIIDKCKEYKEEWRKPILTFDSIKKRMIKKAEEEKGEELSQKEIKEIEEYIRSNSSVQKGLWKK